MDDNSMRKRRIGNQPITHRMKHAIRQFKEMKQDGSFYHSFKKPNNLTLITYSNYPEPGYFEKSLDFLGIHDYKVLIPPEGEWKHSFKITTVLDFLKSDVEKTKYILFCDSRDTILRGDPHEVVRIFESIGVDLLFNSSMCKNGFMCMPEVFEWTKIVCKKKGRYVNAGVFMGEWDFTTTVFEEAAKYVTPNSLTAQEHSALGRGRKSTQLCDRLPDYPKNADDQDILRFLHPQFWPRMDVDYYNEITYRN